MDVDRHVLELDVDHQPEHQPEDAEKDPDQQYLVAIHTEEADRRQIRQLQAGFPGGLGLGEGGRGAQH